MSLKFTQIDKRFVQTVLCTIQILCAKVQKLTKTSSIFCERKLFLCMQKVHDCQWALSATLFQIKKKHRKETSQPLNKQNNKQKTNTKDTFYNLNKLYNFVFEVLFKRTTLNMKITVLLFCFFKPLWIKESKKWIVKKKKKITTIPTNHSL